MNTTNTVFLFAAFFAVLALSASLVDADTPVPKAKGGSGGGFNCAKALITAVRKRKFNQLKELIEGSKQCSAATADENGFTALHFAAKEGFIKGIWYLVDYEVVDVNVKTKTGVTPIHLAARGGHASVVQYFVDVHNVDPCVRDDKENTPLLESAAAANLKALEYLAEKCHSDFEKLQNKFGRTPLHYAAGAGRADAIKLLVKLLREKEELAAKEEENEDASAKKMKKGGGKKKDVDSEEKNAKSIDAVIQKWVNTQTKDGGTALHSACGAGDLTAVKALVEEGQADVSIANNDGVTPLDVAKTYHRSKVVKYLKEKLQQHAAKTKGGGDKKEEL